VTLTWQQESALDREVQELERMVDEGEISEAAFRRAMRNLHEDVREIEQGRETT